MAFSSSVGGEGEVMRGIWMIGLDGSFGGHWFLEYG